MYALQKATLAAFNTIGIEKLTSNQNRMDHFCWKIRVEQLTTTLGISNPLKPHTHQQSKQYPSLCCNQDIYESECRQLMYSLIDNALLLQVKDAYCAREIWEILDKYFATRD